MPRKRQRISDLVSKLGLRAPYSRKGQDWNASPWLEDFYKTKLGDLARRHSPTETKDVATCPDLQHATAALCEEWGPSIWGRNSGHPRPWLFSLGEGAPSAPYAKKLYYDDEEDQAFIRDTLHQLVIEKVLRYRETYGNKEKRNSSLDNPRDDNYTPGLRSSRTLRTSRMIPKDVICCWDPRLERDSHLGAERLKNAGVWLGNWAEEKEAVYGPSFDDVTRAVFIDTLGGLSKAMKDGPPVLDASPDSSQMSLECAGCQMTSGNSTEMAGGQLIAQCIEFEWEEEQNHMMKHVWAYKCSLDGVEVFAMLKNEGPRPGHPHDIWSFWRLNGGYTTSILLRSADTSGQDAAPSTQVAVIVSRSDTQQPGQSLREINRGPIDKGKKRMRDEDPCDSNGSQRLDGTSSVPGSGRTRSSFRAPNGDIRRRVLNRDITPAVHHTAASMDIREPSFESLYDCNTPPLRSERIIADHQQNRQHASSPAIGTPRELPANPYTIQPSITTGKTQEKQINESPQASKRISLWLHVDQLPPNIVAVDTSMTVQAVFAVIRKKIERKLDGKTIRALTLSHPELGCLDVEGGDDEDGWGGVPVLIGAAQDVLEPIKFHVTVIGG